MATAQTAPTFDLQSHSTHSDGALAPVDVVERAAKAGVTLLALTDHDTVDGVPEALAAARITASSSHPRSSCHPCMTRTRTCTSSATTSTTPTRTLLDALEDFRADRVRRIFAMADRLRELGFELDDTAIRAHAAPGRPHIADALLAHPANAERLREEGIDSKNALFPAYLVPGRPATCAARARPSPRRSTSSTPPAGWPCGRTRSGI